ncbi:hypothetical protein KAR48_11395 [bacterium]|nr:hypothetical protein [bacterium]
MRMWTIFLFNFLIAYSSVQSQHFITPESIVFDKSKQRFLVSNKEGNYISEIDSLWNITKFSEDICKLPRGLFIKDSKLYSACTNQVVVYDLKTDSHIKNIKIKGATFLNDITSDNNYLYVSDSEQNKIYRINLKNDKYEIFIETHDDSPNGLYWEKETELIYVGFRWGKDIIATYDSTGKKIWSRFEEGNYVDGIAKDKTGTFYIGCWSKGVYSLGLECKGKPKLVSGGHLGAADIHIVPETQILAIPNFLDNSVDFIKLNFNEKAIEKIKNLK